MNNLIATAIAIVGSREDGDHVSVVGPVVALHHQLVSPEERVLRSGQNMQGHCTC